MELVFVFGTLKCGFVYHHHLQPARFVGEAKTAHAFYDLIHIHEEPYSFPGLVSGEFFLQGEVFEITPNHIRKIDDFEDTENLNERRYIQIEGHGSCWAYFLKSPQQHMQSIRSKQIQRDHTHKTVRWIAV